MSYWVLHIADPHFSRSHFNDSDPAAIGRRHAMEVKDQLREHDLSRDPFHALVLSGDYTFAYDPKGFVAAAKFVAVLSDLVLRGAGQRDSRQLTDYLDSLGLQRSSGVGVHHTRFGCAAVADRVIES